MIYADNAATTALDADAFEAMKPFFLSEYGNASQPYSFSRNARKALRKAREIIAACINAHPSEIFFTSGGTEGDNWAIKGMAASNENRYATITSSIEHHAILRSCASIERQGYPVAYLPVTNDGTVTPDILKATITNQTYMVSIMLANNEIGTIQPIKELCSIAHEYGAYFHTDAVQAVGHIKIDVQDLGVDLLSASAHKFNGPKGIGFMYIKEGTPISSLVNGGGQERGYRAGTENVAAIVGMAEALRKNCSLLKVNEEHITQIEEEFINTVERNHLDFIRNGSSIHLPGNVNISLKNMDGEMLLHRLDLMGICISTGSACDSEQNRLSHVIQAIDVDKKYARGTIRLSFGINNKYGDGTTIANALLKVIDFAP